MNDKVYVGIDFGDLELRVAYIADSQQLELPLPIDVKGPHMLFDPYSDTSPIGVAFPTVQQKLGTHISFTHMSVKMTRELHATRIEQSTETPESMFTRALATINQRVLKVTGKTVGGAVIAVPTVMTQNARRTLLDCAHNAGFTEVNLVDRCTAAALSYHSNDGAKSTTALVYDLGYGNCEYALLRLAGERCRVMSAGSVSDVSGQALDALVIEAIVLELRKKRIYLGLKHFTPFQWQELREVVVQARQTIGEKTEALITLVPDLTGLDVTIVLQYFREPYRATISPLLNKSVDAVHGILDQNALQLADIDTVLLVGSSAVMSPIYDMLAETFGSKATRTDPLIVANGAAWHAQQQARQQTEQPSIEVEKPTGPLVESPAKPTTVAPVVDDDVEAVGSFVTLVETEDKAAEQPQSKQGPALVINADKRLEQARRLIEEGKLHDAERLLDTVAREVESLRSKLAKDDNKQDVPRMWIDQAVSLVESGLDFGRAVELTHRAYHEAPDDPEVFEGMLRVHAQAALQMARPEEYENSIRILSCALNHDQTDRAIRQALAERHYQHALAVRGFSEPAEVFAIVDHALAFDAKHAGLNKLHKDLAHKMAGKNQNNNDPNPTKNS
jgi:actin-like ATPase involved in cell morphogenesis